MNEDTVKFNRKLTTLGGSLGITIPTELIKFIEAKSDEQLTLIGDVNSKGQKYIAIFKEG